MTELLYEAWNCVIDQALRVATDVVPEGHIDSNNPTTSAVPAKPVPIDLGMFIVVL